MKQIIQLLEDVIFENKLIYSVISNMKGKNDIEYKKVTIKPVQMKNTVLLQFEYHFEKKVIHKNLNNEEAISEIFSLLDNFSKQGVIYTTEADYQIFVNKKNKVRILKNKPSRNKVDIRHNKKKNYIIQDGTPCPFLVKLGVMNENGNVHKKRYNKFRQINKFLEMVSDVVSNLNKDKTINIVDFGCGKSYLTFALYHYLVNMQGIDVNIVGLDLKEDVINLCSKLAIELNFDKLKFFKGDIKGFEGFDKVDMVVTLHACDTATDDALVKAVEWEADVILSVPCCQHELFNKIHNPVMKSMVKHGIIKERLSALITDSIRAEILEILGYSTQIMEFIDMEHTPKNILIRAVKSKSKNKEAIKDYIAFKEFWNITPYIESAMGERLKDIL